MAPLNRFPRMVQEYFVEQVRQVDRRVDQRYAALTSRQEAQAYVREVQQKIQRCFGPWPEKTPLNPRITGVVERDTYRIENVVFQSRPNFLVTANLYVPKGRDFPLPGVVGACGHSNNGKAYLQYQSFAQGLARQGYVVLIFDPIGQGELLVAELIKAEPDAAFYTVDVRGVGESRPDTCDEDSFFDLYGSDYFYAIHSIMLDRPYIGQRTFDVLRVLDWLRSIGHDDIHLAGKGWGSLPAAFAAVVSGDVRQVTLKDALTSYSDIAESQDYAWPLSTLVPNVLAAFDLPDCYNALKARNLRQVEPWGPDAKPATANVAASGS